MTIPTQRVLRAMLEDTSAERYGIEIADLAALATGTVHPTLARLERIGWLESRWEDVDPRAEGRAARRDYRLTTSGVEQARDALARAYRPPDPPSVRAEPEAGREMTGRGHSNSTPEPGPTAWAHAGVELAARTLPAGATRDRWATLSPPGTRWCTGWGWCESCPCSPFRTAPR